MTDRITTASLAKQVATHGEALEKILGILQANGAQHSTPSAVADVVESAPAATPPPAEPAKPATASDQLFEFVTNQGLAFSRGGRVQMDTDQLKAAVRVLQTGTPALLNATDVGKLSKRGITHLAIGRADDGKSIITQYVYSPDKA